MLREIIKLLREVALILGLVAELIHAVIGFMDALTVLIEHFRCGANRIMALRGR